MMVALLGAAFAFAFVATPSLCSGTTAPLVPAELAACLPEHRDACDESLQLLQTRKSISRLASTNPFAQSDLPAGSGPTTNSSINAEAGIAADALGRQQSIPEWSRFNTSAADMVGVTANSPGDFDAFMIAMATSVFMLLVGAIFHGFMRNRVPMIYNHPEMIGDVPEWKGERSTSFFGMFSDSLRLSLDEIQTHANLDYAMLIEYTHLCMKIMAIVGLPSVIGLSPAYALAGGNAAGDDRLSKPALANVLPHGWLFWLTPFVVWFTVIVAQRCMYSAMTNFVRRRSLWLKATPAPEGTTILVEHIPMHYRSDAALKEYFNKAFHREVVESAAVVKYARSLKRIVAALTRAQDSLLKAKEKLERTGKHSRVLDQTESFLGTYVDEVDYYEKRVNVLKADRDAERQRVLQQAESGSHDVYCSGGFVTFHTKLDAEIAMRMAYTPNAAEFVTSYAPDPQDIIYEDLKGDPEQQFGKEVIGYACILGVFVLYSPVVLTISSVVSLGNLEKTVPNVMTVVEEVPLVKEMWDGLVAALALSLVTSFLPTIILSIFKAFFVLRAKQFSQYRMQNWYYQFLIVFVLMATAVGNSLVRRWLEVIENPTAVRTTLAESLPCATHFYLDYVAMAWSAHATVFMRYMQLFKYWLFRMVFDQEEARQRAEPEDQDYFGMGSLSARFSLIMAIGLVYSALSPLMCILVFVHFFVCKMIYGYLFVFCQDRSKADLGGAFFVQQLHHMQQALFIYVVLMVGVLEEEASNSIPGILTAGCLVYLAYTTHEFRNAFRWEALTLDALADEKEKELKFQRKSRGSYVQPELVDK